MTDSAAGSSISAKRILLVEDATDLAAVIQEMLEKSGHQVETSCDGRDAVAKFEPGKYDLIVTDYLMPNMNGIELAHAVRKRSRRQRIMLITAYTFSIAAAEDQPLPVDFILRKPFHPREFHEAMGTLFAPDQKPA